MAEKSQSGDAEAAKKALPSSGPKPVENPAFRMMGLPRFKFKLPSRNWLIFISITGSFATAILYDRHHKKRAQQRWCNIVSHVAQEPLSVKLMPRRITVFLSAPPGDSLRVAREHFHEYIKPILVAGALDWEVVEGRREGEVRAGLAEKVRKLRRRNGEKPQLDSSGESKEEIEDEQRRHSSDIDDWHGVQGDLILGRHTWKEYVRGLHEGWLGPLDVPPLETPSDPLSPKLPSNEPTNLREPYPSKQSPNTLPSSSLPDSPSPSPSQDSTPAPSTATPSTSSSNPSSPVPPYISPSAYPHSQLPPSTPDSFAPSLPLALPHLLGFLNTPTRLYRFLTQRHLANSAGASVAALVLGSQSRSFTCSIAAATPADNEGSSSPLFNPEDASGERRVWEQEQVLEGEEGEWHKSAREDVASTEGKERVWRERMVVDKRIGDRMRVFELASEEANRAIREDAERVKEAGWGVSRWMKVLGNWVGIGGEKEPRGWDMGLVGEEDD